ncbi:hypothetical protein J6590_037477 [Homalodisca vitripennis]|nr:hypothetical protein J6590_007626 [Homalodisca vitripennis]KAG8302098.1 hypothetical protein J6590_037477 [Homalodisca vitripennis]
MAPIKVSTYERLTLLVKNRFTKILKEVEKIVKSEIPLTHVVQRTLNSYLSEVSKKRNDFEANLARIVEVATNEELSVKRLSTDQDEINDLFIQISGLIESAMSPEEAPSTPSVHSERQTPLATL